MRLRIHAADLDLPVELRRSIDRDVHLALGRHAPRIGRSRISLRRSPEPGSGAARCRIHVRLCDAGVTRVNDVAGDPRAAVSEAVGRVARRLDRIDRLQGRRPTPTAFGVSRIPQGGVS